MRFVVAERGRDLVSRMGSEASSSEVSEPESESLGRSMRLRLLSFMTSSSFSRGLLASACVPAAA